MRYNFLSLELHINSSSLELQAHNHMDALNYS